MILENSLSFLLAVFILLATPCSGFLIIVGHFLAFGSSLIFFLALGAVLSELIYLTCLGINLWRESRHLPKK